MATNITYRKQGPVAPTATQTKGAPLTAAEIDGNFKSIQDGLAALEQTVTTASNSLDEATTVFNQTTTSLVSTIVQHVSNTDNPHNLTKAKLGLGNVDNTSDELKNSISATLTNKTLTNPTINGFTGSTAAINIGGGQIIKDTSGNVGIGCTNTSGARLAIAGGSASKRLFSITDIGTAYHYSDGNYYFGATAASEVCAVTNNAVRMRIDSIGTTTFVSAAFGYGAGAGGTVTQATSKSTSVTLNKPSGKITMHNATMAPGASIEFSLNNLFVSVDTIVVVNCDNWPNYIVNCQRTAGVGCLLRVTNYSGSSLSEAVAINFAIIKVATT